MKKYLKTILVLLCLTALIILYKDALTGNLSGTFKHAQVPDDYISLEQVLDKDEEFGRTLWVPQVQRFAFYNHNHPAVAAANLYKTQDLKKILTHIGQVDNEKLLADLSIRYVVVPYDTQGEIFLDDRKYSEANYKKTVDKLRSTEYLTEVGKNGKVVVFKIDDAKPHVFSSNTDSTVKANHVSPTKYALTVSNAKAGDIITFTESYDPNWKAQIGDKEVNSVQSQQYNHNTFKLTSNGNINFDLIYKPQKIVDVSSLISLSTLTVLLLALIYLWFKNRKI